LPFIIDEHLSTLNYRPPLPFSFQILIRIDEKIIIEDHKKHLKGVAIG